MIAELDVLLQEKSIENFGIFPLLSPVRIQEAICSI